MTDGSTSSSSSSSSDGLHPNPPPRHGRHPDIGTAWLILSHGVFFGVQIATQALIIVIARHAIDHRDRLVHFGMLISFGIFNLGIGIWTGHAIILTWLTANKFVEHVFGSGSFFFLLALDVILAVLNLVMTLCILTRSSMCCYSTTEREKGI